MQANTAPTRQRELRRSVQIRNVFVLKGLDHQTGGSMICPMGDAFHSTHLRRAALLGVTSEDSETHNTSEHISVAQTLVLIPIYVAPKNTKIEKRKKKYVRPQRVHDPNFETCITCTTTTQKTMGKWPEKKNAYRVKFAQIPRKKSRRKYGKRLNKAHVIVLVGYRIETFDISNVLIYRNIELRYISYRRRFALDPLASPYFLCWYDITLNENFQRIK